MSSGTEERQLKRQKVEQVVTDDHSDSDDYEEDEEPKKTSLSQLGDVYLETVNRKVLDFDFEKRCCVSLSTTNIYGCLVCGKYYQGRNKSSQAFLHSINEDHHIFINFSTLKFYVLPEDYELDATATEGLKEIQQLVFPSFSKEDIAKLDTNTISSVGLNGKKYNPGFIGMNNFKVNDYSNVILQALSHISPIRNFMIKNTMKYSFSHLFLKLALLIRKVWSKSLFKSHISSHELMQYISQRSKDQFTLHVLKDPKMFLIWLLNNLKQELAKFNNNGEDIITKTCQGTLIDKNDKPVKFWLITLSLPEITLFKDGAGDISDIPQVNLIDLVHNKLNNFKKVDKWPSILFLHVDRFSGNKISGVNGSDRNPTIVRFPADLEMKLDLVEYKLIGNIVYELESLDDRDDMKKHFKIQLLDKARDQWVEINDLLVKTIEKELMFIDETYLQVWEKI